MDPNDVDGPADLEEIRLNMLQTSLVKETGPEAFIT